MCLETHPSLYLPQMRERGLRLRVMLCWRGLCTTHIHRLITTYISVTKLHNIWNITSDFFEKVFSAREWNDIIVFIQRMLKWQLDTM